MDATLNHHLLPKRCTIPSCIIFVQIVYRKWPKTLDARNNAKILFRSPILATVYSNQHLYICKNLTSLISTARIILEATRALYPSYDPQFRQTPLLERVHFAVNYPSTSRLFLQDITTQRIRFTTRKCVTVKRGWTKEK